MHLDKMPIEAFVQYLFQAHPLVSSIVAPWKVEPQKVEMVIIQGFREMGIFWVANSQRRLIVQSTVNQLRYSPELNRMLREAEAAEQSRTKHRHND